MKNDQTMNNKPMGASISEGGVNFKVWAPHAEKVLVVGNFNNWSENKDSLIKDEKGCWSGYVNGVKVGDQYRYMIHYEGKNNMKKDPYSREVTNSAGNSVIHDPHFDWGDHFYKIPESNKMVIYEMHIGTFHDEPGGPPGTFMSAIEKLQYLKNLGINMIEVMPPAEFAGGFSWGYNPADPFAIESDYGGPGAFKEFIKTCHEMDIGIILDVVYNHFGPGDLDLWQFDGWKENDKGGIFFYNDHRSNTPWGETRPDYGREEVRRFIYDNVMMWFDDFKVDGLRWDMTAFIRNIFGNDNDLSNDIPEGWSLMQWINSEIKNRGIAGIKIAEDLKNNVLMTKESQDGGAGFDAQWDAGFVHPVREMLLSPNDESVDMNSLAGAVGTVYEGRPFSRVIYTESHDEVANGKARVPYEITKDDPGGWIARKKSTLGAALVFTSPGIPMLFQGQEFLEDEWFRDINPVDWEKTDKYKGILKLYQDLIRIRLNLDDKCRGLSSGNIDCFHINNDDKIIAYHRWDKGGPCDSAVVIANLSVRKYEKYKVGFPMEGQWIVRFNSDWSGYSADFSNTGGGEYYAETAGNEQLLYTATIDIGPYSVLILSQDM